MRSSLQGRFALVTGVTRGIGRAIALGLAQSGAYDKGLLRRWIELQLKKDEWQLTRNKVLIFVGLTLTTLLVLTVLSFLFLPP